MRISAGGSCRISLIGIVIILIIAFMCGRCRGQSLSPADSAFLAKGNIDLKAMSSNEMYVFEQVKLISYIAGGFVFSKGLNIWMKRESNSFPLVYQMAKPRGLFDGLDRETHFIGGFGLYYYLRRNGFSKANSYGIMTIGSLLWEVKDSFRFMDYRNEWFRKTSVGNVLIHAAGDGFDIQDHWCVMLGGATAVGLEYLSEGWQYARIRLFGNGLRLTFDL